MRKNNLTVYPFNGVSIENIKKFENVIDINTDNKVSINQELIVKDINSFDQQILSYVYYLNCLIKRYESLKDGHMVKIPLNKYLDFFINTFNNTVYQYIFRNEYPTTANIIELSCIDKSFLKTYPELEYIVPNIIVMLYSYYRNNNMSKDNNFDLSRYTNDLLTKILSTEIKKDNNKNILKKIYK